MKWLYHLAGFWPHLAGFLNVLAAALASGHAMVCKRDSRAAALWVLFIWFVPLVGPVFYLLFGINRIRRRAISMRVGGGRSHSTRSRSKGPSALATDALPPHAIHLRTLARLVDRVVGRPLIPGNKVEALLNGDAAYPAMLAAIREASRTISLSDYIPN